MRLPFSVQSVSRFLETALDLCVGGATMMRTDIEAIGRGWRTLGICPGDLVLLALPNGVELLEQFFAVLSVGGVPALIAPNLPSARLREMICMLGARAVAGLRLPESNLTPERRETLGRLYVALFPLPAHAQTYPGEVVLLTSGTSGFASGCIFDLEALLLNAERHADSIGQQSDDVVLVNLPLYFSFALVAQALATFVRGGRLVISGPPFHASTYEQTLARFDITISSLTPLLTRVLLQRDSAFHSSPRVLTVGGDSLAPEHVAQLLSARPGDELYLTYGLTQAGPRVSTLAAHRESSTRYASVGKPLAGTRVCLQAIGDDTGYKQLCVSSATVMKRPLGLVEGRTDMSHPLPGTVATGDIFDQDAEGYLYFRGRVTDYFVRNGEKISLATVRRIALRLPEVVNARTQVVRLADGTEDFELALHLREGSEREAQDYAEMLHRWLRRAEFPGRVSVLRAEAASGGNYK